MINLVFRLRAAEADGRPWHDPGAAAEEIERLLALVEFYEKGGKPMADVRRETES